MTLDEILKKQTVNRSTEDYVSKLRRFIGSVYTASSVDLWAFKQQNYETRTCPGRRYKRLAIVL